MWGTVLGSPIFGNSRVGIQLLLYGFSLDAAQDPYCSILVENCCCMGEQHPRFS